MPGRSERIWLLISFLEVVGDVIDKYQQLSLKLNLRNKGSKTAIQATQELSCLSRSSHDGQVYSSYITTSVNPNLIFLFYR